MPHLPGVLDLIWRFLEKENHHFHNKININRQNARLDEFQRPGLMLQRDFLLAFAVLDPALRPPVGSLTTVPLVCYGTVLYLLLS
jgi:hypothetical protein